MCFTSPVAKLKYHLVFIFTKTLAQKEEHRELLHPFQSNLDGAAGMICPPEACSGSPTCPPLAKSSQLAY